MAHIFRLFVFAYICCLVTWLAMLGRHMVVAASRAGPSASKSVHSTVNQRNCAAYLPISHLAASQRLYVNELLTFDHVGSLITSLLQTGSPSGAAPNGARQISVLVSTYPSMWKEGLP